MTAVAEPIAAQRPAHRLPRLGWGGWCAAGFLVAIVLIAVLAPVLAPADPNATDLLAAYAPPSGDHWLGTDATGRDIASRLMYGARPSLLGPAAIVMLALALGVPLALLAAWRRGTTDFLIGRTLDILFSIPGLLLAILAVATFGPGLKSAVAALSIAYLPYVGRLTKTAAQGERDLPYVQVLEVQGHGAWRVNTRHILRNLAPVLAGQATVAFAYALIDLGALSFLGLGIQAPMADWGVLVGDRDAILKGHPLGVMSAATLIVVTVFSLLVLGSKLSAEDQS